MNGPANSWDNSIRTLAGDFPYPPTPDIARNVRIQLEDRSSRPVLAPRPMTIRQRALLRAAVLLILFAGLMAVPQVRAAVLEFLEVGVIRIFLAEPTMTPAPTATGVSTPVPTPGPDATQAFTPTPSDLFSLAQIAGSTSLESAMRRASYPLRLPGYPPELGEPDRVFLQEAGEAVVILVWTDTGDPERASLILFQVPRGSWVGEKVIYDTIEQTLVNQQAAVWAEGPHALLLTNGEIEWRRLVTGHVLIWEENGITYRLESELSLEEAIRVAESLAPIP